MAPYPHDAADLLHLRKESHHLFQGVGLIPAVIIGKRYNITIKVGKKCIACCRNTPRRDYKVAYSQLAFIAIQTICQKPHRVLISNKNLEVLVALGAQAIQ